MSAQGREAALLASYLVYATFFFVMHVEIEGYRGGQAAGSH